MTLVESLLPEFDHETAVTRRVLERAPDAAFAWRPHDKSWTLAALCGHLARVPHWGTAILTQSAYDLIRDGGGPKPPEPASIADVLATFDRSVSEARAALLQTSEAELMAVWSLKRDGAVLMSMPRVTSFKRFTISHLIHHRGQLSLYLRLQNVPVPPIYGPTADEAL